MTIRAAITRAYPLELAQAGRRFEAIRRYRELTGVTTQEAADVVDGVAPAR
jgi:ribosomal protein L7/L12